MTWSWQKTDWPHFRWDHTRLERRFGLFTMIAEKKDVGWLIIEAQNTNCMPGPNPELNGITPPIVFPKEAHRP